MKFEIVARFPGRTPIQVLRLLRDDLPAQADRLPSATRVEVVERHDHFTRLKWFGRDEIPGPVKHLVDPGDLYWFEETHWDEEGLAAASVVHRPGIGDVRCSTHITFAATATGAEARFEGELKVGLPLIGGLIERYIVRRIEENLRAGASALAATDPTPRELPPPLHPVPRMQNV